MTLLAETIKVLSSNKKTPDAVRWIGVLKHCWPKEGDLPAIGSWADFERFANFEYNSGYGGNEIASHLVIVGDDWWLERGEYDGSEWWEFKTIPSKPIETSPLRASDLKET